MPAVAAPELEDLAARLLRAAGASEDEAATVARHCVAANLAGHDSHGVILIPTYVDRIAKGHIVPGAPFEVVRESAATAVVDGHFGFGFVVSERAMRMTIDKAARNDVAATTVRRQSHVGRLTDYALMAAEAGMIGIMTADSGRTAKAVAPFGGRVPRLGTNPLCIAMPSDLEAPFFIDIATSAAAAGKLKVAASRGEPVPEGWLVDAEGRATTDPNSLEAGGAVLPLGGPEGHKGYGLSAMIEILSGVLTGLGFGVDPDGPHNDGVFMAAFRVEAFRPLDTFRREVAEFATYLNATPTAEGFERVYYPGEIEAERTRRRLEHGIEIEEETWAALQALAARAATTTTPPDTGGGSGGRT